MRRNLFAQLANAERDFRNSEFMSPVLRGQLTRVRIAGINLSLKVVEPWGFEGWGVFRPTSFSEAVWVRQPTLSQRRNYLELFPKVQMVLSHRNQRTWVAMPVGAPKAAGEQKEKDAQPRAPFVPVRLAERCQAFDQVIARFDGALHWFDRVDTRRSMAIAQSLRSNLEEMVEPDHGSVKGSTTAQREVYRRAWEHKFLSSQWDAMTSEERRVANALRRGGGVYRGHREVGDSLHVTYEVDGYTHASTVDRKTLTVQSAGICLDGYDANFDLQSLVGVMKEGRQSGELHED